VAVLDIHQFPCLSDNYGVLIREPKSGRVASIDAPEAAAVEAALAETGWTLTDILVTHHHYDHIDGIPALKAKYGVHVTGPAADEERIPTLDTGVRAGETVRFGETTATVMETPGHTLGHIIYWFGDAGVAFVGDTLFSLGCGRVPAGHHDDMWASLDALRALPGETLLYCGHEYTAANARFALSVDGDNEALKARAAEVEALRAKGVPTLPVRLEDEMKANPFLRPEAPAIRAALSMPDATNAAIFSALRSAKDRF